MDIRNDVKATAYQVPAFMAGTEMETLYLAMKERWGGVAPSAMRLMQVYSTVLD